MRRSLSSISTPALRNRSNLVLMGPPGSGKSSVAQYLANNLKMPSYDIDNDHLEPLWGTSVADKLTQLGDNGFLHAEAQATMQLPKHINNTIISLTGSNPLHPQAMDYVSSLGHVIYLDVPKHDIIQRMHHMKVDRIVGQATNSLSDILDYRTGFYERSYDARVLVEPGASVQRIGDQVLDLWRKEEEFISTRGYSGDTPLTFLDVVHDGMAPDRGLYVPQARFPRFSLSQLQRLVDLSYSERALRVLEQLPTGLLGPNALREILTEAYSVFVDPNVVLPVTSLGHNRFLMETFHGPTASFKDLALQVVPKFMRHIQEKSSKKQRVGLLVATSGDTGCAALDGFGREPDFPVVVLYPLHGVSMVQQRQMITSPGNCLVIGVESDFDFCQTAVKDIFEDREFNSHLQDSCSMKLSAANSINWGRLFPQIVFAFSGYLDLVKRQEISMGDAVDVAVPTGNFGNILGVYYAKQMGLPVDKLICVSNDNNVLFDFLNSGTYDLRKREMKQTISPSVDILVSSNLERFLYQLSGRNGEEIENLFDELRSNKVFKVSDSLKARLDKEVVGKWCSEDDCLDAIREVYNGNGKKLVDPHTALAVSAVGKSSSKPVLISATAHYAKFPDSILDAVGVKYNESASIGELYSLLSGIASPNSMHPSLTSITQRKIVHSTTLPPNIAQIKETIAKFFSSA
jgi:threonine synthase